METIYKSLFLIIAISIAQVTAPSLTGRAGGGSVLAQKAGGVMTGTTATTQFTKNTIAVLKNGTDGLGFYPNTATTSVKANTAYVAEPRQLLIDLATLDAPLVGVKGVKEDGTNGQIVNGQIVQYFDLSGRKTTLTQKGIYVKKKQKFVIKP